MRVVVPWGRVALGLELPMLPGKPLPNPAVRARELQAALGKHGTAAGVARACGVTRASVCQDLTLLRRLPAEVLEAGEVERDPVEGRRLTLRKLLETIRMKGQGEGRVRSDARRRGPADGSAC